ncbi:MAG: DUF4270 domain-containing protein [Duncaniella sp.]|nr:DUF4270 domain-containing protein [Duncaniella sp.]
MRNLFRLLAISAAAAGLWACDDSGTTAGSALITDEIVIVRDSLFTIDGISEANPSVRARTVLQLLGRYSAEGYGTFESDVVCQYLPSASIDTVGVSVNDIDSVKLVLSMYKDGFAGDSLAPMGLTVHRLTRQLPSVMYSDFDPSGYYDPEPYASTSYTGLIGSAEALGKDSEGALFKNVYVDLPIEFARDLYNEFATRPSTFETPQSFAEWFPGFYIANSFGSGRATRFSHNAIEVYYKAHYTLDEGTIFERDTVLPFVATYLGVTPEVMTNNNIRFDMAQSLKERVEGGEPILVAPVGYDVEFRFPAREILAKYKEQSNPLTVVNDLTFALPAIDISNEYGLKPPPYILMVKKSKKEEFFANNQVTDDKNSFYAAYDSDTKKYKFSSMLAYINDIISKGEVLEEDEEFVICPVLVSFYTTQNTSSSMLNYYYGLSYPTTTSTGQVSTITPYVTEPVMAKLDFEHAKIEFSFAKQTFH